MNITQFWLIVLMGFLLSACNNSDDQLPSGTKVKVAPTSYTWTVTELLDNTNTCIFFPDSYQDNVVHITVTDSEDRPIGEVDISLYLSPSNNTSPPGFEDQHVFYLYDDFNGNGVVNHPEELVSGTGDPILYETDTEKYHGTKTMIVRTNTSCGGYRATLHVYAGDGYGTMEINTEAADDDETI